MLPPDDPRREFKYRVVFGGNSVIAQIWDSATFQHPGSSPTSMATGKFVDDDRCRPGHNGQQADAEQVYTQAFLDTEHKTWITVPAHLRTPDIAQAIRLHSSKVSSLCEDPISPGG